MELFVELVEFFGRWVAYTFLLMCGLTIGAVTVGTIVAVVLALHIHQLNADLVTAQAEADARVRVTQSQVDQMQRNCIDLCVQAYRDIFESDSEANFVCSTVLCAKP